MFAECETVSDPIAEVHSIINPAAREVWRITRNLSDCSGSITADATNANVAEMLRAIPHQLERLRSQLLGPNASIARKDGQFGVLYQFDFGCHETDATMLDATMLDASGDHQEANELPTHHQVMQRILAAARELSREFPGVKITVPMGQPSSIPGIYERPALWVFVRDGQLGSASTKSLAERAARI